MSIHCHLKDTTNNVTLLLDHAPLFLRVVYDTVKKQWDALDKPDDVAGDDEEIYVVERDGDIHSGIMCERNKPCRVFQYASYFSYASQPERQLFADNERWSEWVEKETRKENP